MIRLIPAIDIIDGKCVRLTRGDYTKKEIYNSDPLEVAKSFEDAGLRYLHLVDLDGAKSKHIINHRVLEKISRSTSLQIDFGGGIKTENDAKIAFESGASQINCGSIAVDSPEVFIRWLMEFGSEKIILSADSKNGFVASHGWIKDSGIDLISFIKTFTEKGLKYLTCTDITTDGMLEGPNFDLYSQLKHVFPNQIITASGGISCLADIKNLNEAGINQVIIGKAIYENRINLSELKKIQNAD